MNLRRFGLLAANSSISVLAEISIFPNYFIITEGLFRFLNCQVSQMQLIFLILTTKA